MNGGQRLTAKPNRAAKDNRAANWALTSFALLIGAAKTQEAKKVANQARTGHHTSEHVLAKRRRVQAGLLSSKKRALMVISYMYGLRQRCNMTILGKDRFKPITNKVADYHKLRTRAKEESWRFKPAWWDKWAAMLIEQGAKELTGWDM